MAYKHTRPETTSIPRYISQFLHKAWSRDSDKRPDFTEILEYLSDLQSKPEEQMPSHGHVNAMKNHWENQMTSQKPLSPFEELRRRMDKNGYVADPVNFSS